MPGANDTIPVAINNRGDVAGYYDIHTPDFSHFEQHGFVRDARGNVTTLDYGSSWPATEVIDGVTFTFLFDAGTSLNAINDRGRCSEAPAPPITTSRSSGRLSTLPSTSIIATL